MLVVLTDWRAVMLAVSEGDFRFVAAATIVTAFSYLIFAGRWGLLLRRGSDIAFIHVFAIAMIGYMASSLMPLRLGDPLRALLLSRHTKRGIANGLGSIAIERVCDVVTLLVLAVVVATSTQLPVFVESALYSVACVTALLIAILGWAYIAESTLLNWVDFFVLRLFGEGSRVWLRLQLSEFLIAIRGLKGKENGIVLSVSAVLGVSILAWTTYSLAIIFCLAAFGVQQPIVPALFLVVVTNFGSAIPSTPGAIGVYHALAAIALLSTGVPMAVAVSVAIVTHAVTVAVHVLLGLIGLLIERRNVESQL